MAVCKLPAASRRRVLCRDQGSTRSSLIHASRSGGSEHLNKSTSRARSVRTDAASGKVALSAGRNLVEGKEGKGGLGKADGVLDWKHFGGKVVV